LLASTHARNRIAFDSFARLKNTKKKNDFNDDIIILNGAEHQSFAD